MRDRYGLRFVDDGASFRQRRACSLVPPRSPARRLLRLVLLLQLPFAAAFVLSVAWAVGTALLE